MSMLIFMLMLKNNGKKKHSSALRRLREEAGLTQTQLAKQIPDKSRTKTLTQSAISRWESGEDEPELTVFQMKAFCRALGKSLDDLPDEFASWRVSDDSEE